MEFASKSVANAGLGTGIAGLSLGVLNSGLLGGRGLFGGWNSGYGSDAVTMQANPYVTKDMLELQLKLTDAQKENAILNADLSSEKKMVEVYNASVNKTNAVRDELSQRIRELECKVDGNAAAQSVINCQHGSQLNLQTSQISQLYSLTKMVIPNHNVCPGWGEVNVTPAFAAPGGTTSA